MAPRAVVRLADLSPDEQSVLRALWRAASLAAQAREPRSGPEGPLHGQDAESERSEQRSGTNAPKGSRA